MPKPRGARAARCGRCSDGDWFFAEALPLSAYRGLARAVVLRLKETGNPVFADALARLYFQSREAELRRFAPDCVVAVPMNWRRKYFIRHGINSPETLAKRLATELGVPLASRFVKRVRATSPQTTVEWSERALNVRDAFAIDAPRGARPFVSKRALLVDDALSSCATANEISRILLAAGAEAVCVAALTRGGLD